MRICLIASSRFPIREPFAGGLEAHTFALAEELHRRGHQVSLFAAPGSQLGFPVDELDVPAYRPSRPPAPTSVRRRTCGCRSTTRT